jgi:transcriptional regulator with XRE-family HTH domain
MIAREIARPAQTCGRQPRVPRVPGTLGDRLTRRRLDLGLTQRQVAEMAGLNAAHVAHLERDAYGSPPMAYTLAALATALQTSLDWLWFGEEQTT